MPTVKEEVKNLIDELPEEATLDDIEYHLYVKHKIELSQVAVREGKFVTHEEALTEFRKWKEK
jgi:hypothetical protein